MKLYHGASPEAAAVIMQLGFLDDAGKYGLDIDYNLVGVWVHDHPVGETGGETFLEVLMDPTLSLEEYELVEEGSPYREWVVPARILNEHGITRILTET